MKTSSRSAEPSISVVIVTWNGERYVERLLHSLAGALQHCSDAEVIFVDNGSTDKTPEIIKGHAHLFNNRLKLIQLAKNIGYAGGNNVGIAAAKGDVVFLLNQDTYVDERAIREVLRVFREDPRVGVAQCFLLQYRQPRILDSCGDAVSSIGLGIIGCYGARYNGNLGEREVSIARGAALAIRRSMLEFSKRVQGAYIPTYFVAGGYEDWYLSFLARLLGYRVILSPGCVVYHDSLSLRQHDPYILYNALNLFTELSAPLQMLVGRVLISLLALAVTGANPLKFLYAITAYLKRLRKRIQARYIFGLLMKKKSISPVLIWGNCIGFSDWLRWYISYQRLALNFEARIQKEY